MTAQNQAEGDLLLVDDDRVFCDVLGSALTKRGFSVRLAHDVEQGRAENRRRVPAYAIVDLQMPGPSGLELVAELCETDPDIKLVVLTGYASIATAVEAIKLGATHYLTKPTDTDEIVAAFRKEQGSIQTPISTEPISVQRLQWEHIQRVLNECDGNISEAARRLGMHRRTLQRKLFKRPVKR